MANSATYNRTKVHFAEGAAASTPDAAEVVIYAKADGLMYSKDDAGAETLMSSGTGLANPMTTGGDVIYGGASGTPTRLANGSAGQVLTSAGTTLAPTWETPASGTPTRCGAHAYRNAAVQNINSTTAALALDAEVYDTDGFHDNVTNNSRMTIPAGKGGVYQLSASSFASGSGLGSIGFTKNGALVIGAGKDVSTTGGATYCSASTTLALAAADYVEVSVTTNANINLGHATVVDAYSSFSVIRISD